MKVLFLMTAGWVCLGLVILSDGVWYSGIDGNIDDMNREIKRMKDEMHKLKVCFA